MQPLLQWKSSKCYIFWACACSLRYPARNTHVPHCHLWPFQLYNILPHYLINSTIFEKKLLNIKHVFWFSQHVTFETFSFQEELSEIWSKIYLDLHAKHLLFLSESNETWIFSTDVQKIFKHQISRNSVQWKQSCSVGTDVQTWPD